MKKILAIITIAFAMLATSFSADAQFSRVRFGVAGGFTSSSTNIKNFDTKSVSLYHAGITCKVPLFLGFAIQPSVLYQVKGASLDALKGADAKEALATIDTKVGYVEIPVQVQWGPDLIAFRPYVFAEPFIGFRVYQNSNFKSSIADIQGGENFQNVLDKHLKKTEYGLAVGAGIEFMMFQLSAKYFWNFGQMYGEDDSFKDMVNKFPDEAKKAFTEGKSFNGLSITLGILF